MNTLRCSLLLVLGLFRIEQYAKQVTGHELLYGPEIGAGDMIWVSQYFGDPEGIALHEICSERKFSELKLLQ